MNKIFCFIICPALFVLGYFFVGPYIVNFVNWVYTFNLIDFLKKIIIPLFVLGIFAIAIEFLMVWNNKRKFYAKYKK